MCNTSIIHELYTQLFKKSQSEIPVYKSKDL